MESIYSMGTQAWRQWVTYWTDKVKTKADLINGKLDPNQLPSETPNWKTYKALLTQVGENAPVARVLNQDEADYLGDIEWVRNDIGQYIGEIILNENLTEILHKSSYANNLFELYIDDNIDYSGSQRIFIYTNVEADTPTDGLLYNFPIEIKVRQRGTSPVLLSAETNEAGDKVILTFDKKMSGYGLENVQLSDGMLLNMGDFGIQSLVAIDNVIELLIDPNVLITSGVEITLQYIKKSIESLDYGLLQPFENFPVKNNVIPAE